MAHVFCKTHRNSIGGDRRSFVTGAVLALALAAGALYAPQSAQASGSDPFLRAKMMIAPPSGARGLCSKYDWACAHSGSTQALTQKDLKTVQKVNRRVNRQISEVADLSQYRKADYWTLPLSRRGDCEDFALLKKKELIRAGIAPERLLLTTVLDRRGNSHAVLVLRADTGDYVLDNLTDRIKPWKETRYTFLRMQSPDKAGSWVGLLIKA
ncbi:transglutaminase-like cysteine peptidase [uncultured Roseobacter sp.]|uniref:transglutaminase-like cysteine peptidase n=1 Tax=uncultured Roseobacter sp. TaxID=114847 RepID=UPI00262C0102|nr:transglutaminase-like cysteine peptidase [uncultured Roseobacter sp.]